MKKKSTEKILETDLYKPIHDLLVQQGYTVRSEVHGCDVTAVKGDELVIIELKCSFNLTLLTQAVKRQRMADSVYVAIPRPKGGMFSEGWKDNCFLLRRLELGLITVSFKGETPFVEIAFHPAPFDTGKSKQVSKGKRRSLLNEIGRRHGDFNTGGSTRRKLMTAYKEDSIHIGCLMEKFGPLSPRRLKELGAVEKAPSILQQNFYNWFERVARGSYDLSPQGRKCLEDYPELAEYYRKEIEKVEK
jgi:hypothetical protein